MPRLRQAPRVEAGPIVTLTYEMHAVMSRALRLEYDDVDERIVEIAAPEGGANDDVMRMVDTEDK